MLKLDSIPSWYSLISMEGTTCTNVHYILRDILLRMDYVSMGEIICTTYICVSICEYAQVIFFWQACRA